MTDISWYEYHVGQYLKLYQFISANIKGPRFLYILGVPSSNINLRSWPKDENLAMNTIRRSYKLKNFAWVRNWQIRLRMIARWLMVTLWVENVRTDLISKDWLGHRRISLTISMWKTFSTNKQHATYSLPLWWKSRERETHTHTEERETKDSTSIWMKDDTWLHVGEHFRE